MPEKVYCFYNGVRAFFVKAVEYSLQHMPFNDALLKNARFADFDYRLKADVGQAEYFVSR